MLSHIGVASLPVIDPDRAISFYSGRFGMTLSDDAPYVDLSWITLQIPGARKQLRPEMVARVPNGGAPSLSIIARQTLPQ